MIKNEDIIRPHAETLYADELKWLQETDTKQRPMNWELSPWAVVTYICGGEVEGRAIETKYFGNRRLMEIAVATLATDRALLLLGVPGTAKTWVAEHLTAAISGNSTLLVQGTAGMNEDQIRYGWNYARLLTEGPTKAALVASPIMRAMETGKIGRIEELTRMPSDVQDSLITLLSEKILPVPELGIEVAARKGFNIIATANDRDRGVNDLSSALRRRFNTVVLPLPASFEEEVKIVQNRVEKIGKSLDLPPQAASIQEIKRLVKIFRELRNGVTDEGTTRVKSPSSTLSTAEAISVITNGQALAAHFGNGEMSAADLAASLTGAIIKDPTNDKIIWLEYLETVVKTRTEWKDLYTACKEMI